MSFDLYIELGGSSTKDVDEIVSGRPRNTPISDIATRIRLLTSTAAVNEDAKEYAIAGDRKKSSGYKSLVHSGKPQGSEYARKLIREELQRLRGLGLLTPSVSLASLPAGSWFLQLEFTLAKPWINKDDDPFYVAKSVNPVRKDKVFKLPLMSAASWKGLLRWTAMHVRLALRRDRLKAEDFARERFRQALLFGDEKGEEPGQARDFAACLDGLNQDAAPLYRKLVKQRFELSGETKAMPHYSGRLTFYPTFFNLIDVEVINPHSRKTKAGTNSIYLECVPAGAKGTFSLLYVPTDLIGKPEGEVKEQAKADLVRVAEGVSAMMLTYGFSAKRTSGFGAAEDKIKGALRTRGSEKQLMQLGKLPEEVEHVRF